MSSKGSACIQVAIDSNAYRNIDFINYLKEIKQDVRVFVPSIVFLEIGYFFLSKGLTWAGYKREIEKFGGIVIEWSTIDNQRVVDRSVGQKATLPFTDHVRDFIIGVQCETLHLDLISYNKRHFEWCSAIKVMTPEEFVQTRIE